MPTGMLTASARRYARAAFDVASESQSYNAWLSALNDLARILEVPNARIALTSPAVGPEDKRAVLDRLFPSSPPLVRSFLHILADRDRLKEVPDVAAAFQELLHQQQDIVTADVTTAVALDADMSRTIAQRLGAYLLRNPASLEIRSHVDPDIIGGVVARIGDTLIDDSIRGRLERLHRALAASGRS